MTEQTTRRDFMIKLATAAAAFGMAGTLGTKLTASEGQSGIPFADSRIDPLVGEAYLTLYPDEVDPDALIESVLHVSREEAEGLSVRRIQEILAESIRSDFAEGRVIELKGWRMSRSECRFYALQTLLSYGV